MSTPKKKVGDRIRITGGRNKGRVGVITGKERRGWTVELEDGKQVNVSFPLAALVETTSNQAPETTPMQEQPQPQPSEAIGAGEADSEAGTTARSGRTDDSTGQSIQGDASGSEPEDLTKLTVKQLQALAKQRGIGIARTKADFLRIIKAKHPDEDLERLKGKALFDRVSELHISRLRSKDDLLRLLQPASDRLQPCIPTKFPDDTVREGNTARQDTHKVRVPPEVLDGILAVRRSGLTNMLDQPVVARIAGELGFPDAARWIEAHPKEYAEGVFRGFEAAHKDRKS